MSKTVLAAVDISDQAQDAAVLQTAGEMAQLMGAQLDVVTVVPDYGMSVVGSFFEASHHDAAIEAAKVALDTFVSETLGGAVNAKVRHVVATGKAYQEILRTAEADSSDLIVIGAHAPDLEDFLLGPNAARVVRHAKCSVYVVR